MAAAARLLDLTRLVSRLGRGPMTGIDRVEYAYLTALLAQDVPLFALIATRLGYLVLDRRGAAALGDVAGGARALGAADLLGRILWRGNPARAQAEAEARRLARVRVSRLGLARALRVLMPDGFSYLNVGHSNLGDRALRSVKSAGGTIAVLVHDTIPLDHPEFTRPGIAEVFARKMRAVAARADLVIHSTHDARHKTEAHLTRLGRCPPGVVAPLGVVLTAPDASALPPGLPTDRPYVICISTVEPRKNHAMLLDVWDMAASRGAAFPHLFLVGGKGWAAPDLFDRIARTQGVTLLQGVGDGAAMALLAGARALLHPSLAEGYGLPPIEAAALGIPVIAAPLGVTRELLGDYPIYRDTSDVYSWMETIETLCNGVDAGHVQAKQVACPTWSDHFNSVLSLA